MSSHHFVREQQEPALLLLALEDFTYDSVGELLEWVPTVICNSSCWEKLISWGVKVDVLISTPALTENLQCDVQFPLHLQHIHESCVEAELLGALRFIKERGQRAINVIGLPHQRLLELQMHFKDLEVVIWDGDLRYSFAREGFYKKWWAGGNVQLHAPEGSLVEKSYKGKSQILPITYATFVELEEGITSFQSNNPFWVGEFLA